MFHNTRARLGSSFFIFSFTLFLAMIGGHWRQREHCCSTEASRCGNLCSWNVTIVGPTQSYQSNQGSGTYQARYVYESPFMYFLSRIMLDVDQFNCNFCNSLNLCRIVHRVYCEFFFQQQYHCEI